MSSSAEQPVPASPTRGPSVPAPRASRVQVNVASLAEVAMAPPTYVEADTADVDGESRWWLQVGIGGYRIRALYDTNASRTVMGATGLQLVTALNRPLMSSFGRRAKVVGGGGHTASNAWYVELPFEVAGVKRDIREAVIPDDSVDCYLGANFIKAFSAVHDPDSNSCYCAPLTDT